MGLFIGVLGPFVAHTDDRWLDRLPRKACALLAYLATKPDQAVSREFLGELLWPDRESGLGLHGVRNSLSALRAHLGSEAIRYLVVTATHLRLVGASVDLDLLERSTVDDDLGRLEEAAKLYRGDFLLDVRVASETFQEWAATERSRAHNLAHRLLDRLVVGQLRAGNHELAIHSAGRLVALDRLSERGHCLLMQAYAQCGRRGDALRHYDLLLQYLQKELGVEPEPETQNLYLEIKRAVPRPSSAFSPERPSARWSYLAPKLVLGIEPIRRLGDDSAPKLIAERFDEDLVIDLFAGADNLEIVRGRDPGNPLPALVRAELPEVDYVVSASVQSAPNDQIRLNVFLTEANTGALRWVCRFERNVLSLPCEQTDLTREIAGDIQFAILADAARKSLDGGAGIPQLDECLARGKSALGERSTPAATNEAQRWLLGAVGHYRQSVEALAILARTCHHVASQPGWADSTTSRTALDIGRRAAAKALQISPGHAEAECFKGMLCSSAGELETASAAFDRAVQADCSLAIAHAFGGYNAAFLGRAEETLQAVERAIQIGGEDRRRSVWWFFAGFAELLLGRPWAAVSFLEKSLNGNPGYGTAQLFLAAAFRACGKRKEAESVMASFKANFAGYKQDAFTAQWLSRSRSSVYRAQISPLVEELRQLGLR
jgi:DNA-binding SARP family transcriptional activator/TolB-like protein